MRETTMQIRLSFEEKATLKEKSEGWGEPKLSAWVRARLLEAPAIPPEDAPGTIDQAMAAERKRIENDPSNLNVTLDDQGALVAKEVGKPMAYESPPEEVEVPIDREAWIESMTRIHMMEKSLSKHAARAKAVEEYEATQ
jgi:hypothetical protein